MTGTTARNVLGTELEPCSLFLEFSRSRGNDLITPRPEFNFPGLKPGDQWCLCAMRWKEAFEAGLAPPVVLQATHERALDVVTLTQLRSRAYAH